MFYEKRYCKCKESSGNYTDELNVVIHGKAVPIGFANLSFVKALRGITEVSVKGGIVFEAFVIPESSRTVKREE